MMDGGFVKRVTPVTILPDIGPMVDHYLALGFSRVIDTDDPGCVGLQAGKTYIILTTRAFCEADYGAAIADALCGTTIPYLYVESVDKAVTRLPAEATVIGRGVRSTGEVLALMDGQYLILAER